MKTDNKTIAYSAFCRHNILILVIPLIIIFSNLSYSQTDEFNYQSSDKSTFLAFTLSMQPLPIDLGNLYAGHWRKGVLYSALELTMFIPGVVMFSNGSNTQPEDKEGIYTLVGTYILMKIISAFDAGIGVYLDNGRAENRINKDFAALLNLSFRF